MFCIKKGNSKYCVSKAPLMNYNTIINTFLTEMKYYTKKKRSDPFFYLTPKLKEKIGGISGFENYLSDNRKRPLVNLESFKINEINKISDTRVEINVGVTNSISNDIYMYKFTLLRMYDYANRKPLYDKYSKINLKLYWRISAIVLTETKLNMVLEGFSNTLNVNSEELKLCGLEPVTGYFRDGYCRTNESDVGTHTICAKVTSDFLKYTKSKGNDLSTPRGDFKGLKDGDKWCLCAIRWREADEAGKAPPVDLAATNKKTLEFVNLERLKRKKL